MLHDFIDLLEEHEITYSWFQQDGATAHTANNAMKLLNEIFRECVISRNLMAPSLASSCSTRLYICGKQHHLQSIVIAHVHLMS
jgi:hypothetical protein